MRKCLRYIKRWFIGLECRSHEYNSFSLSLSISLLCEHHCVNAKKKQWFLFVDIDNHPDNNNGTVVKAKSPLWRGTICPFGQERKRVTQRNAIQVPKNGFHFQSSVTSFQILSVGPHDPSTVDGQKLHPMCSMPYPEPFGTNHMAPGMSLVVPLVVCPPFHSSSTTATTTTRRRQPQRREQ